MDNQIDNIVHSAIQLGACNGVHKISDYRSLVAVFFKPQGIEFCKKHNYPSIDTFREVKDCVKMRGVYIDRGKIHIKGAKHICLVGNTDATIYASGVKWVHTIILMHGAKATIHACNYAVLNIVNISGLEVKIHKDQTVVNL